MAKGGGRMSFTGGTYNAGKIVIDANEALKSANDLDAALQRVGSTLTNLSKGRDVSALWDAQAASIENVVQALEQFRRNTESVGNAEGLIKAMNAFSAWHPDENISSYFDRMGDGAQTLIDKAKQLAVNLDSAFDVSSLREAFQVFDMLKSAGVDLEQIFAKLRAGDVSTLTQQVETLERQLTHARYRAQELQAQVDQFQSGDAFAEMQEKINQYESAMERAKSEFRSFLSASGFAGDDLDEYYGRFSDLFERIGNGSLTVKEAMAQVREEYSHMFQSAGADQILEIMTRLESLGTALEGIKETLANMGMANSGSASLGEMREYLVQGADAASHQREELAQLSAQSASLQGLIDVLVRLSQANAEADTGMTGVHQSIVELLSSVQSLGQIDVGNLQQVSDILRSFVKMDGISVGKASVQNLVSAFESLSRLPSTSSLSGLAAIDFSNLSNLKVSKAALSNLAEFLPSISGINVGPLQQLASIDWTNLSNLKVSKASLSNLSEMAQTTGLSPDTSGFTSVQSAIDKIGSSLDGLQAKIKSTFDLSNAISQASELASQYAGVKAALDTAAVAAASANAGGGHGGRAAGDNSDELQRLINLYVQYYDALKRIENARNSNDPYNEAYFTDVARGVETLIASIEKENDSLREQANATQSVQRAMQSWMELVNRNQAKADNKTAEQYRKEAEMAREAEEAIRKKNEAEAASIAKQAAADEARALQEVISQYEKYYDLEAKRINAESSGQTQVATYYRDQATAVRELINSIETLLPDLADQARRSSEVASAISGYNLAVAKSESAEEQKNVKALIDLYVKLYAARTDVAKAYAADGNNEATEIARQRAAAIKAEIDAIVGENAELDKQAQANARVADAIYKHNAAINALNTDKIKQESDEIEKYKQQLESLSQLNVTGKNAIQFAGDETSVERYKAALAELQAKFDAIGVASKGTRAQAVADFEAQRQKVEELRASLNQAAKDQTAASNLANKIELYASKNGAAPLEMRQQWQQWINELRNGDAVARGTVSSIDAEFKRLQNTIRTTSAGGKTFFQQMKEGWSKFGGWSLVTRSFTKAISIMKQAVTAVKEVDSAMTELRKVTDATAAGYDRFYKSATETASSVGAKLSDVINASADFARLGFSIGDASELAKAAMLYTNIGDGITDVSVATESLISTMKAFGIGASDAMSIVDKFNEVGKELLPMPVATRCLAECYIGQSSVVKCA